MIWLSKLAKFLFIGTAIFLLAYCFNTKFAYAEGNNFAPGTLILTPNGNVPIEDLHSGDRVVGYNFSTHQTEINKIKETKIKSSLSYYLINNRTKTTGADFVYINTSSNPKIVRVQKLKYRSQLIGENHSYYLVKQVKQIVKASELYQIILENEAGNLFANNFLVYGGNKIPTIFKENYRKCVAETAFTQKCISINSQTLPGFLLAWGIIIIGIILSGFLINLYNFIRFYGKKFTDNKELWEFTQNINPKFTNCYSSKYHSSNKVWKSIPIREEIDESEYQYLIDKAEIIEKISNLFCQYQSDLSHKNYTKIVQYFHDFAVAKQYKNYQKYLTNKNHIIYQPKIVDLAIIDFEQLADKPIFRVQINGEKTDFTISEKGYVLSGDSDLKVFSEYWDIELNADNKCCIQEISLPLAIRILQLDLEAKRIMLFELPRY